MGQIMANGHLRILFSICVVLSSVENISSDLRISVPHCCQLGINWHREGLRCRDYQNPAVLDVPNSEREFCFKTSQMCCEKSQRQKQCRSGVRTFKKDNFCPSSGSNYTSEGLVEKCCTACRLGAEFGKLKTPCTAIDVPIEEEPKKAMFGCCSEVGGGLKVEKPLKKVLNNQSLVQQATGGDYDEEDDYYGPTQTPNNLCDLLPGQLCAHICVPTAGSYYCKCEEGFVLMEDQKTCQKESLPPVKQKFVNTVSPRVIIPNPEKPVPLHKPNFKALSLNVTNSLEPVPKKKTCEEYNLCEHECVDTETGPNCTCRPGFELDADGKKCKDVNECLTNANSCDTLTEECVNEIGGYACVNVVKLKNSPPKNETPIRTSSKPVPRNVTITPALVVDTTTNAAFTTVAVKALTTTSTTTTTTTTTTATTPVSPIPLAVVPKDLGTDSCPLGFQEISGNCTDINECDYDQNPEACDPDHECINTPGSYFCRCKVGFQENPETLQCEDINECQTNLHNCLASQRCDNSIGSFRCVRFTGCGTGYTLNSQTGLCEDDDECFLKTDNCRFLGPNYICRNTLGSFRCERKRCLPGDSTCDPDKQCPPGYVQGESGNCVDLDECSTGTHNCHPFADVCINHVGGYDCRKVVHCPKGYEATANGCADINECTTKTHNCKGLAECKNEKGSYSCVCPTGFQLASDNSCEDINECTFYLCPFNSKCINTPGSYRCECNPGFRNVNENTCRDVDECSETPGICQHTCINVFGSYRCTCRTGFKLHKNNRTCLDLDECDMFKDQKLCVGECVNIPGSFSCRCPPGYVLGPDGRSCQDVDECLRNPCKGDDEVCLNTRGGYRCNSIKCPPNYVKDVEHKYRCKRIKAFCREDDQNCLQQPLTYSFNFVTFVSMLPIPPTGYVDLFTMRGPLWSGTTSQFTLELLSARAAQKVQAATKNSFRLRNTGWNQGVISLVKPIPGPQEIELQLTMKIYHSGVFVGSGVAKLLIHVSEFEY